ncbi:amidase family protein [Traorella massiliensis]|uniref:amidase family protein n=1 Tax=Traorella massiliensis TaxID=1903263 RepID=UPI0008F83B45|nr:amidase family protein [Traorella massiliensis]
MKIQEFTKDVEKNVQKCAALSEDAQKKLNAIVTFIDPSEQIEAVKKMDESLPLYGVPIAIKDNFNTKGIRTTASSRILDNYVPIYDATVIKKLKDAGAILFAKTSMDELGMGGTNLNAYTGKVNNPYDVNRISGGSSGGSAALVAEGVVPVAMGTDTGDSIRKPAAYCGIVGFKPTYGRISRYGVIPYASSLDHVGFFTTCIKDAARMLQVCAGRDDHDMTSSYEKIEEYEKNLNSDIRGKKIAILDNVMNSIEDQRIVDNFNEVIEKLEKRGAIVERVSMDETLLQTLLPVYLIIANAEACANHSNLDGVRFGMREEGHDLEEIMINSRTKGFSSAVRKRFVLGSYSLFVENQEKLFRKAQKVRRVIVDEYKKILEQYDCVIASAAPTVAPHPEDSVGEKMSDTYLVAENFMILGNMSGYPSLTLPSGFVEDLPIGINVTAKAFDEQNLLNICKAIEEETGLENHTAGGNHEL